MDLGYTITMFKKNYVKNVLVFLLAPIILIICPEYLKELYLPKKYEKYFALLGIIGVLLVCIIFLFIYLRQKY